MGIIFSQYGEGSGSSQTLVQIYLRPWCGREATNVADKIKRRIRDKELMLMYKHKFDTEFYTRKEVNLDVEAIDQGRKRSASFDRESKRVKRDKKEDSVKKD